MFTDSDGSFGTLSCRSLSTAIQAQAVAQTHLQRLDLLLLSAQLCSDLFQAGCQVLHQVLHVRGRTACLSAQRKRWAYMRWSGHIITGALPYPPKQLRSSTEAKQRTLLLPPKP